MRWLPVLLRCIGSAICAKGMRALAGAVPFGDVLYDVAADSLDRFRHERICAAERACLEEVARAAVEEAKQEALLIAHEVAAGQPAPLQSRLAIYLAQVPPCIRQSLRRPSDPSGLSVPLLLSLQRPEDLLVFLPTRLPRFQPGDCPSGIGDWELVELLGSGGFGEVWKARHRFFDGIAPVALKFCLDETARDRLLKYEAVVLNQVMRQARHPGFVPLLDAYLSADPPCLKYELVEGGDLSGLLREWQSLSPAQRWRPATEAVRRLATIVGSAHRLNPPIVHRDLKPANVLVQRSTEGDYLLRVTDFGIGSVAAMPSLHASRLGTTARGDLLATSLRGAHTPLYASPQQIRGEAPDVRDDVHALGVIWYQLLTGDLTTGSPTGLWTDELAEAGLGRELIRLLGACVDARADRRPADAARLAEQLESLAGSPPAEPVPLVASAAAPPVPLAVLQLLESSQGSWLLDLTNKQIGDGGIAFLLSSPYLANRTTLYLSGNQITDAGVAALVASPRIASLSRLILWDNRIGDEGVVALSQSPYVNALSVLDLGHNLVGDRGVQALAASSHLANLNALILVSNRIGDPGALALADSPYLASLAELKPLDNHISAVGVKALRERFGKRVRIY
ncbi:MAG TPA: protein kinase [Gemmataceae bacterium]|nr:protein kinase [Gemmataceae bacterium]